MSIKAKIVALTAVALVITGSVASTTTPAEAHGFNHSGFNHSGFNHSGFNHSGFNHSGFNHYDFNHHGFNRYSFNHYGFIGSEIAANDGYDYGGDHYCRWVPRFDIYGNYIGRVRNCGY